MSLRLSLEVLRKMPMFRPLSEPRLRVIAMSGDVLTFLPGERIAEQGEEGDAAFIVLDGAVDVLVPTGETERHIARLGSGEIVGEMAMLTGRPRSTTMAAHGELTVLRLERDATMALLREFPEIAIEFIRIIAGRLEAMNELVS
ncbi:MAG: cyclic nucleotide-binding domain-containing protein [Pseudomonadota bacterium]